VTKTVQYTREKLLGEGGMGKVYLAHDSKLQRQVAIKELVYLAENEQVNHAIQEARILARVNHTNIIQVYDIEEEEHHTSLVMEYFNSKTLTQFKNENYPTLIQKLELLSQLAAGLTAAHQNDIIHCDLKPSNILVNSQGLLKITDFGVALLSSALIDNTKVDTAFGCLFYMSPEQLNKQKVDKSTDIFSLGIIAYQLLVGSHPFGKGSAREVANRITNSEPEHAKNLMLDTPSSLTNLLMAMLIKPVERRLLTAAEIENRLQHIKKALEQAEINEQKTRLLSPSKLAKPKLITVSKTIRSATVLFAMSACVIALSLLFYFNQTPKTKQIVILKPTVSNSPLMSETQQDLVVSAVEDALRQAVINTQYMYLVSQREVNAIIKKYPDNLQKITAVAGASDIITTSLECNNNRCKVSFSRLLVKPKNNDKLSVKAEKNWLVPVDKFNTIYSTSQTQFASLFPERTEVNQSGLVQRPIDENDYRQYINIYSQVRGSGHYNAESLTQLADLLTRSPYLYAGYSLYRDIALDLYLDSQNKQYLSQLNSLLNNSPSEYRYSSYEAIERFWLSAEMGEMTLAHQQIIEAKQRGADELTILQLQAYMSFNEGQYQKAADSYAAAYKLRPSLSLLYNTAFSHWHQGNLIEAENMVNRLLRKFPNNYHGLLLQANIFLLKGNIDLAINAYQHIVSTEQNSVDLSNLGLAYALNKQYDKALEFTQKAVNQSPEHATWISNLADIKTILGDVSSAKILYQKVIESPGNKKQQRYWLDLSQAYLHLNSPNLAIDALNKAEKIAPNNGEVAYTAALIYSVLNEKKSATFEVNKALSNNVGAVWFNLPWFDGLCAELKFQQLMTTYNNNLRCTNAI
jgi:serine/threonine-protein kinase